MGDPIRVLHAVVNMNRGGAETLLMNLYRNIDREKVQFDFLTCKEGDFDREITEMGGIIHRTPYVTEKGHFGYVKALNHFFSTHKEYVIVHSHMDKMSGIVLREAKKNNVPIRIAHSHNTSSEGGTAARLYKWYAGRTVLSSATHLLACSQAAANWLFKGKVGQAVILKNGIEADKYRFCSEARQRIRKELDLTDQKIIGHVGRFNHQKNHTFLIDIFSKLHQSMPETRLVLAGDGPLKPKIEQKVKNLNLEKKVIFTGVRSDINHLLQAFDLFLFPSLHEGLPVTLIEAQGAGLPCVISNEITKEADMGMGLMSYVPLGSTERWIEEIKKALNLPKEREEANRFLTEKGYDIKTSAAWTQGFYSAI